MRNIRDTIVFDWWLIRVNSQSGGQAIADVVFGKVAPAGRLVAGQYPADYVNQVPMTDMTCKCDLNILHDRNINH